MFGEKGTKEDQTFAGHCGLQQYNKTVLTTTVHTLPKEHCHLELGKIASGVPEIPAHIRNTGILLTSVNLETCFRAQGLEGFPSHGVQKFCELLLFLKAAGREEASSVRDH